jgi:hypothetical protein
MHIPARTQLRAILDINVWLDLQRDDRSLPLRVLHTIGLVAAHP